MTTVTHTLDKSIKTKKDDRLYMIHNYGLDFDANHIYLDGREEYINEGEEPGVEFAMANRFIRNINILMRKSSEPILVHQKTCFSRKTPISTLEGQKKIPQVKVGDMVLTHTGQYKKVTETMSHMYSGEMVTIYYARKNHATTSLTATSDHPIMIEREGVKQWIAIKNVVQNDIVFIESGRCEVTGEKTPFFKRKKNFNCDRLRRKQTGSQQDHLTKDIIPYCDQLVREGWKAVPVGAGVIPDIVAFKDGKITVFEVEKMTGKSLEVKKEKYDGAAIHNYIDSVTWYNPNNPTGNTEDEYQYTWYEVDEETGFVKVKVTSTEKWVNQYAQRVYNLSVEEDNSFVANHVVVHNCGGDYKEGMAIHNIIQACPNKITMLVYTHARSMSSLILQAADKRVMMPDAEFMFHGGTTAFAGTQKQFLNESNQAKIYERRMLDIYIDSMKNKGKFSHKSKKFIESWLVEQMNLREDVYLSAKDAVLYGFADEVFGSDGVFNWDNLLKY